MTIHLCCHHRASCSISDQLVPWCAALLWKGWAASFEALQEMDIQDQQTAGGDYRANLWCVGWWLPSERREHHSVTLCLTGKKKKVEEKRMLLMMLTGVSEVGEMEWTQERGREYRSSGQMLNGQRNRWISQWKTYNTFQIDGWHWRTEPPKVHKGK